MKQFFLPAGLLTALFSAIFLPKGGHFISSCNGLNLLIITIFLVSGYQTGGQKIPINRKLVILFLTAAAISLLLAPLVGLLVSNILLLSQAITAGLIIISSAPPTISSGVVITEVSKGNALLALFLTIVLNITGIFTLPIILDLTLRASTSISIDQTALLGRMLFFVLLPFVAGKCIRGLLNRQRVSPLWSYVNSSCVIIMVYTSAAVSSASFHNLTLNDYATTVAAAGLVHVLLLLINTAMGKILRLPAADHKALVFVASQKTLAVALAVIAGINIDKGAAIVVCLTFHFFQLMLDSFLASVVSKENIPQKA